MTQESFICELEVTQSFICNSALVVQPLWFWFTSSVCYGDLLQKERLHLCSGHGYVVAQQVHASRCQKKNNSPTQASAASVGRKWSSFSESVLRFSQTSSLPVNGSWSSLYHRHHQSRADTSVWGRAPQETSVTRRWMEMYQRWINTPNNFPPSFPHCNRCYSSCSVFPLPWCNVVPLLFIYALIPALVLSGCGSWMCTHESAYMQV